MLRKILIFNLLLMAQWLAAQDSPKCQDVIYMKGGSIFRGTITRYDSSQTIAIVTWSGAKMEIPINAVKRVVQECDDFKKEKKARSYDFKESGWYHSSRVAVLFGDIENGYSVQHSSGLKLNRFVSVGLGIGLENYAPGNTDPVIAPVFVDFRGYLTRQRIAPFYALGVGRSYIAKETESTDWWGWENNIQDWKGGWMAQGQLGYRIGNHFLTYVGIRLQRLDLKWDNSAWNGGYGTDKHLKKRIEFGVGLLL